MSEKTDLLGLYKATDQLTSRHSAKQYMSLDLFQAASISLFHKMQLDAYFITSYVMLSPARSQLDHLHTIGHDFVLPIIRNCYSCTVSLYIQLYVIISCVVCLL